MLILPLSSRTLGVGCDKASHFDVSVEGGPVQSNPTLEVEVGKLYVFNVATGTHPVALHTAPGQIASTFRYTDGVLNGAGIRTGQMVWLVPATAPSVLYYQSEASFALFGRINVVGKTAPVGAAPTGTPTTAPTVQPRFWLPSCDGVSVSSTGGVAGSDPAPTAVQGASAEISQRYQEKLRLEELEEEQEGQEEDEVKSRGDAGNQRETQRASAVAFGLGTRKYYCSTTTRAEQLMDLALFSIVRESSAASETCFEPGAPGIFSPVTSARFYMAIGVAQFNAWSIFDVNAKPVRSANPPQKRTASRDRKRANKELAMTFAVYETIKFILPNRVADTATSLLNAYGLEMESPADYGFAAIAGVAAAKDFIETHLAVDGSNQEKCYKTTVPDVRKDAPVILGSLESVNQSRVNRIDLWSWADIRIPGLVGDRPGLTPHAGLWSRVAIQNPSELIPTTSPLPSHEQLDLEMRHVASLKVDDARKVQVAHWADGPKSSLPPGNWLEIAMQHVARRRGYNLDTATKLLLLVSVGNYEGGVACWEQKYLYRTVRPQEYIALAMMLEDCPNTFTGPYCPTVPVKGWAWRGYAFPRLNTPAFPEYPSGHSTFSNASATIIGLFTGSDKISGGPLNIAYTKGLLGLKNKFGWELHCFPNGTTFDGSSCTYSKCASNPAFDSSTNFSPQANGVLGPFENWTSVALNAGESRLYGGYHPQSGNVGGLELGREVGVRVFQFLCKNHIGDCSVGRATFFSAAGSVIGAPIIVLAGLVLLLQP